MNITIPSSGRALLAACIWENPITYYTYVQLPWPEIPSEA